jgi:hypothetical protein
MNTDKIDEANIVTEPPKETAEPAKETAPNLLERLNVATEKKEPSKESEAKTWDFSDDEPKVKEEIKPAPPAQTDNTQKANSDFATEKEAVKPQTPTTPTAKPTDKEATEISNKAKHASARIAVGMLDLTQKSIFIPLLNRKYKKKFNDKEIERLEEIADANKSTLDETDMRIRTKFDRLMKKRDKKIDAVELEDQERKDLESAFYTYMDVTGNNVPPEYLLMIGIMNTVGKRGIDLFMD